MTQPVLLIAWNLTWLFALGCGALWWMANRATHDRRLRWVLLASYSARVLLATALFLISYWRWPILESLQTVRGFWNFGLDANVYHDFGAQVAEAWTHGTELPRTGLGFEYFAVVGALYRLLGPNPLYPLLVNSWLGAVTALLVYLIGQRLFDRRAAFLASLLAAWWPSTFVWSSQLLRDSLTWVLLLASLWLIVEAVSRTGRPHRSVARWVLRAVLLGMAVIALTRFRFYLATALCTAAVVVLVPAGVFAVWRTQVRKGVRYAGIALLVVMATLSARTLNTFRLLSPREPEQAHCRLANEYWDRGQLDEAGQEFSRAIRVESGHKDAYLGLAAIKIQQGDWDTPIWAYERYLEQEDVKEAQAATARSILARLYVGLGNVRFLKSLSDAVEAYDRAVAYDPSLAEPVANAGLALARMGQFEQAAERAAQALDMARPGAEEERIRRVVAQTYLVRGLHEGEMATVTRGGSAAIPHEEAAIRAFAHAVTVDPSWAEPAAYLAQALVRSGELEQADRLAGRALELAVPGRERTRIKALAARTYTVEGALEFRRGHNDRALEAYARVHALDSANAPPAFVQLGLLLASAGERSQAGEMFRQAFEPGQPRVAQQWIEAIVQKIGSPTWNPPGERTALSAAPQSAVTPVAAGPHVTPRSATAPPAARLSWASLGASSSPRSQLDRGILGSYRRYPWTISTWSTPGVLSSGALALLAELPSTAPSADTAELAPLSKNYEEILNLALGLLPKRRSVPSYQKKVNYRFSRLDVQAQKMVFETSPESMEYLRQGFISVGGHSLMDPLVQVATPRQMLRYLPRALAVGFLAPFPRHWIDTKGSTGGMRLVSSVEMLLVYLLLPGILWGIVRVVKQRQAAGLLILAYVLIAAIPISMVVANLGTLFRLRLLFFLPLLVVGAAGNPIGVYLGAYATLRRWIAGIRGQRQPAVGAGQQG